MSKDNDGTYLQDKLQAALKPYSEMRKAFWHRFPDTKSAGGFRFLSPQPSDYLFVAPGVALLIECKSTRVGADIITLAHHGDVGKRQIAKHKLWHRAGHPSLYLYGDLSIDVFHFYDGRDVVSKNRSAKPVLIGAISSLPAYIAGIDKWGEVAERGMLNAIV